MRITKYVPSYDPEAAEIVLDRLEIEDVQDGVLRLPLRLLHDLLDTMEPRLEEAKSDSPLRLDWTESSLLGAGARVGVESGPVEDPKRAELLDETAWK